MKRLCYIFLTAIILIGFFPTDNASAEEPASIIEMISFIDGSYAIVTLSGGSVPTTPCSIGLRSLRSIKSGSKTYTYYSNTGAVEWSATLTASFSYTGSTSSCTSANCTVSISNNSWYLISKTCTKSGNAATANVTMGLKYLGKTVQTIPITITLSCDANGNLA